jgi:hypothetical protein
MSDAVGPKGEVVEPDNPELEDVVILKLGPRDVARIERVTRFLGGAEGDALTTGLALLDGIVAHMQGGGKVYKAYRRSLRRSELLLRTPLTAARGEEYLAQFGENLTEDGNK